MTRLIYAQVLALAVSGLALAAPPDVPTAPLKLAVGEDATVTVKVAKGKKGSYGEGFKSSDCLFFRGYSPDESEMTFLVRPKKAGFYRVVFWTVGEGEKAFLDIDAGTPDVVPPPTPKPDDPPAPKPPSPPVTSFKVILVYESGDTLTAAQRSILFGKDVEAYLTTACTGGKAGWGRRDKDENPASDTSGVKDVWAAAKPKLTGVPCIAVAVNGTITLEPLPATPADAVALLKTYSGGK